MGVKLGLSHYRKNIHLRAFENKMHNGIFGTKGQAVAGG
jgi:hypothetical protein